MRIKRLQLTSHSTFQSASGRVSHRNLGASAEPRRRCGSQLNRQSVRRRVMEAPTLRSILVFAPSLLEARRFYGDVLGLSLERETAEMLLFHLPGLRLAVFRCEVATSPESHSKVAGSAAVFSVPSLERAMAELSAKGVRFLHSEPAEGPLGRYVAFCDPFGTVHELAEAPGEVPAV